MPKTINERVRKAVLAMKSEFPQYSAQRIRNDLLTVQYRERFGLIESDFIPQKRAIQYLIENNSGLLEKAKKDPKNKPWHVIDSDIPPQALPVVLKLCMYFKREFERDLTIREAKWGAKLSALAYYENGFRRLVEFVQNYSWQDEYDSLTRTRHESLEAKTDERLYAAFAGRRMEPVFGDDLEPINEIKRNKEAKS
jgi:hypothetical protein